MTSSTSSIVAPSMARSARSRADAVAHEAALLATGPADIAIAREVVVQGQRRRCRLCREPVVLDDLLDPESWRHADDANDLGDHTAEV